MSQVVIVALMCRGYMAVEFSEPNCPQAVKVCMKNPKCKKLLKCVEKKENVKDCI